MVGKFYVGQATTDFFFPPLGGARQGGVVGGGLAGVRALWHTLEAGYANFFSTWPPTASLAHPNFCPSDWHRLIGANQKPRAKPKQGLATGGESSGCHSTRANQAQGISDFRCLRAGKSSVMWQPAALGPRGLVKAWEMLVGARSWGKFGTAPYGVTRIPKSPAPCGEGC